MCDRAVKTAWGLGTMAATLYVCVCTLLFSGPPSHPHPHPLPCPASRLPCAWQEDAKRAAENDEDTYLESAWANPKALKSSLLGTRDIRWG